MSKDKDELLRRPINSRNGVLAASAAADVENKPAEPNSGPEKQVCTSPGITTLTDNTKRVRLSNSQEQATSEGPVMLQQKTRREAGPSFTTDEKPKKSLFPQRLSRSKKEKQIPYDKTSSPSAGISHKGVSTLAAKEHYRHTKRSLMKVPQVFRPDQDSYSKGEVKPSAVCLPVGSSVDYEEEEEDLYRDEEEIEREKELLVWGPGCSVFPENKLSVAPEVEIMDYCWKEWRGNTSSAKRMRKPPEQPARAATGRRREQEEKTPLHPHAQTLLGYEAVSQKFISIRRVRGDNYCAVRATLFQALSQTLQLPNWLQNEDIMLLPEKLIAKYNWITEWRKLTGKTENWAKEIRECLLLLKQKWESISKMKTLTERQAACDELFRGEEDEYNLYEAVKFLMLNTAIRLYEDNEKGLEVPEFSWLLFARDTSSDPFQLMKNHLNQLGHTGGLEQVEMFLLAYALQHSIHVYRLYKFSTDEFITLYPSHPEEGWPVVILITEDDRHYNIPVRMCEETSL